ncbi:MAG: TonB-dependent receptor [Acidobacteria bacterium]|nr:TonB-dependent receptor [Acidobacteriota bacterium]
MVSERGSLFFWIAGWVLCIGVVGWAQAGARLAGSVQSASGAALAKATLTVRGPSGIQEAVIETDAQGRYETAELAAGKYEVKATAGGYAEQVRQDVELEAGQTATVNFLLEPLAGGAAPGEGSGDGRSDPVSAAPTASAAASVIDAAQLVGLPMNGRSYTQLATLQAGVSDPQGGGRQGGTGSTITISGGRGQWNSFLLDGTDINDTDNQVPQSAAGGQLGADALLQVQVLSVNYGAQYGRAAGGVLNAITRAGSNDLHGTLFEFLRNSKVDSRNFFDPEEPPPFKRNQFGGTVGGPILRDQTFFLASAEILKNRLTETFPYFVPDNDVRASAAANVKPYIGLYPRAETPVLNNGRPTGIAENRVPATQPTDEYFFMARIDQRLGQNDALFGRYAFDDAIQVFFGQPYFRSISESRQQYATLTETHFFSLALLNTIRLSYTRPVVSFATAPEIVNVTPEDFFLPSAPQFGSIRIPGMTNLGPNPQYPSANVMNSYQVGDDVLYNRGAHTWRFGFLAERFQWNSFDSVGKSAIWTFSSLDSFLRGGDTGTRLDVALPGSSSYRSFRESLFGLYVQDDYKIRPNLTLNAGLRHEFTTMIRDKDGRTVHLRDERRDARPEEGPLMSRNPSLRNLAPRLGISWSPGRDSKTVIRAGFGIYYDQIVAYSVDSLRNTFPFYNQVILQNIDVSKTFPDALQAAGNAAGTRQLRIFEYADPKTPTVYRYHFTWERELAAGAPLQITYVGQRGNHLLRSAEINQFPLPVRRADGSIYFPPDLDAAGNPDYDPRLGPDNSINPAFRSIDKVFTDAQSFYNSLVLSLNPRPWKGLTVGGNYTFSKSVDDASTVAGGPSAGAPTYGLDRKLNRSLSSFDSRHRFSMRYFYTLPFGPGQAWLGSGVLSQILGGWRVGGVLSLRSGQSAGVQYGLPTKDFLYYSERPNWRAGYDRTKLTEGVTAGCNGVQAGRELGGPDLYFDPCAFEAPAPGTIGNVSRTVMAGPGVENLDFSLQKEFSAGSERRLQFRAEFFNLPNHTNFRPPTTMGAGQVFRNASGVVSSSAGRLRSTATTPRQIQFALRLSF